MYFQVDLLPKDDIGYLRRARDMLADACARKGLFRDAYVHHMALVSAKTGYGIEKLVSRLIKQWDRKGTETPEQILKPRCFSQSPSSLT